MKLEEEFRKELTEKLVEGREAFIVEQLSQFVEKTDDGLVFNESVKVRLVEIEDFKQRVREAIEKVRERAKSWEYGDNILQAMNMLEEELGL